ncbi:hypothetical protein [Actinomadura sp. GTD37]|uniref:hypothetical protein n=1 Tax=Actinomadura sp. GTD37 TaxID=1778030 RepID=UPI0035C112A3
MIGRARSALVAAVLALSVGCSGSSSGDVVCAPCPPPVTVTVSGLHLLADGGWRLRACIDDLPCRDLRVPPPGATGAACGSIPCVRDGDTLRITLDGEPRSLAGLPVRVTASRPGHAEVVRGTGAMTFTAGRKPCVCDRADGAVALG